MKHVKTHIDEYLRDELPRAEKERVASHLSGCAECREYADWIGRLNRMAANARVEPPEQLVEELRNDLLALPQKLAAGNITVRPVRLSAQRTISFPAWLASPAPLIRVAALVLIGMVIGYGFWGSPALRKAGSGAGDVTQAPKLARSATEVAAAGQEPAIDELKTRVEELERALLATYLAKVEAAMLHFVTGVAEGELSPLTPETSQNMLSITASLKADSKAMRDIRMARLFGQIESVLMEMDYMCRERDLPGARHVATVIEEEGLLSTLQRLKVGLEE